MMIASMRGVVKRYGATVVLDSIDLDIYEGEVIGLLGPNGAGKTTLIQTLTGMKSIDRGTVELFGQTKPPVLQSKQGEDRFGHSGNYSI